MPQLSRGRAGAEGRPKRVGHKGADALVHGNTAASFDAALAAGVDMIEFDVLPERLDGTGELRLAHDFKDARERTAKARRGARSSSATPVCSRSARR